MREKMNYFPAKAHQNQRQDRLYVF